MDSFDYRSLIEHLFRWLHIAAGTIWIGHLWFFNFVNAQFAAKLDAATKKVVVPELMPRALYWFRWGAAYTWGSGVILLILVFYHGQIMFQEAEAEWNAASFVMLAIVFLGFVIYDVLAKMQALTKDSRVFAAVGFILTAMVIYLMVKWAGFGYRAYVIHTGAMYGTMMAANVWMRIWPAQKKILRAVKEGTAPDPAWVALAGGRSKHNTYMSVPLLWAMIDAHTATMNNPAKWSWLYLLGVTLVGWAAVYWTYQKAGKLKGF